MEHYVEKLLWLPSPFWKNSKKKGCFLEWLLQSGTLWTYLTQWLKNSLCFTSPHPTLPQGSCCGHQSTVYQATSCRVCCGMASAPAPDGNADRSIILSDKGFPVRKRESWCIWTVSVYAHGSHRKGRQILILQPPKPWVFQVDFLIVTLVLEVLILLPNQCMSYPTWWIKWWHPSELIYFFAPVFSLPLNAWLPLFFQSWFWQSPAIQLFIPAIPNTFELLYF